MKNLKRFLGLNIVKGDVKIRMLKQIKAILAGLSQDQHRAMRMHDTFGGGELTSDVIVREVKHDALLLIAYDRRYAVDLISRLITSGDYRKPIAVVSDEAAQFRQDLIAAGVLQHAPHIFAWTETEAVREWIASVIHQDKLS